MNSALSSALLHFVWQGAVLAFLLAAALVFVKSARVRYGLGCTALLAMPIAFAATFILMLPTEPMRFPVYFTPLPLSAGAGQSILVGESWHFDPVDLWIIGVVLLYAYRSVGWMAAQRLRRRGVCAAPQHWQQRVTELSARIRLTRAVVLLESALAETPMTIGLLRPVILMPLGLLAGLPSDQVEAILLHELAHIRRHDYLVNLLQALVEGLLFYHPATWWVSQVIRREREMCCDDLAAAATGDVLVYARALAALEEHRVRVPMLAVTGGSLMDRLNRLLGKPSRLSVAPALVFLLLATAAAIFAFQPAPLPAPQAVPPPATATDPYTRWLNEEVVWIASPAEQAAFQRLQTNEERQMFIRQFWLRRDPTPDTIANELQEEHYRRIAWTNDRFGDRGTPGWKSDQGMVYIKFGPPDNQEDHSTETPGRVKWMYRFIEGMGANVEIEFINSGDGQYRLTKPLGSQQ